MEKFLHRSALPCTHHEDADERKENTDGSNNHRCYDGTQLHVAIHGKCCGSKSCSREYRTAIALVEVGTHSGYVAYVVAYIIGNGCRIARVVLGYVSLNLAHEVGSHIGCLGINTATHTGKQCLCGSTHSEGKHSSGDGDEGCRLALIDGIQHYKPYSNVEQSESYNDQTHYGSAAESNLQSFVQTCTRSVGSTCRRISGGFHAKEACQSGEQSAREESKRNPRVLHFQHVSHKGKHNGKHHKDNCHNLILLLQISHGTLPYMLCNLFHSVSTLFLFHHRAEEKPCHSQCYNAGNRNQPKN